MSEEYDYDYKSKANWEIRTNLVMLRWSCDSCGHKDAYWSEILLEELPEGHESHFQGKDSEFSDSESGHTRFRSRIDSFWMSALRPLFSPLRRFLPAGLVSDWEEKLRTKAESITKKSYLSGEQKDYALERCWELGPAKNGSVKPKLKDGKLLCDTCAAQS